MGRELRMVPPNWEHPKQTRYNPWKRCEETSFVPLHDESYISALTEWIEGHQRWELGEHPDQKKNGGYCDERYFADANGDAPRVHDYRPDWKPEEMTWFQVYETVSEGTPVTPPFATKEALVEYLVANGDFWDQEGRRERAQGKMVGMPCDPWTREKAEAFVKSEWAPTLVTRSGPSGTKVMTGVEALVEEF